MTTGIPDENPTPQADGTEEVTDWAQFAAEQVQQSAPQEQTPAGDNPKWAPFLEIIPEPFHPQVKPLLQEWDKGVNSRFEEIHKQYEPWKPLRERNLAPEEVIRHVDIAQKMQSDPVGFYNDLRSALERRGMLPGEAAAVAQQQVQQQVTPNPDDVDDPYLKEINSLKQQVEQQNTALRESFEQAQQEEFEAQVYAEESQNIELGFQAVEQQVGRVLPDDIKAQIVEKAMVMNQRLGRAVSIPEAATEVFKFLASTRQSVSAPRTIPTGGSIPQPQRKAVEDMSLEDRAAYAQQLIQGLGD